MNDWGLCCIICLLILVGIVVYIIVDINRFSGTTSNSTANTDSQSSAPMVSDQMIAQIMTQRFVQLRLVLEGLFLEHNIQYKFIDIDDVGYRDDNNIDKIRASNWFVVALVVIVNECHIIYITMRGHISRLKYKNPRDVAHWIEDDVPGIYTAMSNKDDIIAYYSGTPPEIIDLILERCNAAAMPHY